MEGIGPWWLVPSSPKHHQMLPALTSNTSMEFCNNRRENKASQSSSFTERNNSTSTQWRLPIRSRRGCHATYVGARLAQPTFTGAMPKRKPPVPLRARGALRAGSGRAALPPRRRRRRRECSALRPAAGSVHCSSAGPSPESEGSGSQQGHPAPTPLNTAGQLSPRRKEHGGAARPVFHRPGDAATGAIKTKRRTATFHTLRAPSNAAGYGSSPSRDEKQGGGGKGGEPTLHPSSPPADARARRTPALPGAPDSPPRRAVFPSLSDRGGARRPRRRHWRRGAARRRHWLRRRPMVRAVSGKQEAAELFKSCPVMSARARGGARAAGRARLSARVRRSAGAGVARHLPYGTPQRPPPLPRELVPVAVLEGAG
ncbi:serine/arginine repetitive matrix protein 1-like [Chiroxiphia lanceolata]|uniref:serine/arginine repetitive matrix protein 1-like n=1 Tax=Chiroxiphia lanceolata TaxID=296741 RepID=UPI0013CE4CF3|nr:serine/arginine repetitive matrix protein 1-like [Chiroxiphia lanceolata]